MNGKEGKRGFPRIEKAIDHFLNRDLGQYQSKSCTVLHNPVRSLFLYEGFPLASVNGAGMKFQYPPKAMPRLKKIWWMKVMQKIAEKEGIDLLAFMHGNTPVTLFKGKPLDVEKGIFKEKKKDD